MSHQHILVVTDFSAHSENSFKWAMNWALTEKHSIDLLYCYRFYPTNDKLISDSNRKVEIEKEAKINFDALTQKIISTVKIPVHFFIEVGFYAQRIHEFKKKHPIDMIVLSSFLLTNISEIEGLNHIQWMNALKTPIIIIP